MSTQKGLVTLEISNIETKAIRDLERKVGDPLFISFCCELNGQRRWNWAHLCHRATYESVQPQESDVARKYFSLCSDSLVNYTAPACNTHSITMISGQGFWNAVGNERKYKLSLKRVSTRDHTTRSRPKDDKVHVGIFKWTASWQKIVGWRDSQTLHT